MKIYTKSGDKGNTSLFGGQRVPKYHYRIDAYGTVDELNSVLGIVRACGSDPKIDTILERIQNELFILGSDLATPHEKNVRIERIGQQHIRPLEDDIDLLEQSLIPLKTFILPGGSHVTSHLHHARTVCRRTERICVYCHQNEKLSEDLLVYLNRLSDLLFVMARYQNAVNKVEDIPWKAQK
ncbi:MAG: cob(I)yrinic acid a,c-diamide adenosyltransferase [Balneolales bacterium]